MFLGTGSSKVVWLSNPFVYCFVSPNLYKKKKMPYSKSWLQNVAKLLKPWSVDHAINKTFDKIIKKVFFQKEAFIRKFYLFLLLTTTNATPTITATTTTAPTTPIIIFIALSSSSGTSEREEES